MSKLCFFMGHRDAPASIAGDLRNAVQQAVTELGITEFVVGQYGSFDRMAARAVVDVKKEYPGIRLTLLLPYYQPTRSAKLPTGFDDILYPDGIEKIPKRAAIAAANRYMVDRCDLMIVYVHHIASNSYDIVKLAEKKEISLIRL